MLLRVILLGNLWYQIKGKCDLIYLRNIVLLYFKQLIHISYYQKIH